MSTVKTDIFKGGNADNVVCANQQCCLHAIQPTKYSSVEIILLLGSPQGNKRIFCISIDLGSTDESNFWISKKTKCVCQKAFQRYKISVDLGNNVIIFSVCIIPSIMITSFCFL